ncbi:MAG TPA: choice-of-anchor tandem repeat GloVer-containing protein [Candidatus Limnocylindrales bacterium]|nr:choice-of-anchor tandem repeat GloVer-containing protein [Candidatus Limnocylindrales bacterium]
MPLLARPQLVLSLVCPIVLSVCLITPSQAQTFTVLHNFTGGADGYDPSAGLTIDRAGHLYGTTLFGGYTGGTCAGFGCGTVFRLIQQGSGWLFTPLYSFQGAGDGSVPSAGVVFGPNGRLYGATQYGGNDQCSAPYGCGTIFDLAPPAHACGRALCAWTETVDYRFNGGISAESPTGNLIFDGAGNIDATAAGGGLPNCYAGTTCGVVYELSPSRGGWGETDLYSFTAGNDGYLPASGVIRDQAGNLYGTALYGGDNGCGTVFQLTPSGSGWSETTLRDLQSQTDGCGPNELIADPQGNLYGTDRRNGPNGGGTVFELTKLSGGGFSFRVLYAFSGMPGGPMAGLTMDSAGNLYGTTYQNGAHNYGSVFKLTKAGSGWTYSDLYDFTGGSDGAYVMSTVTIDANGNLYGTASEGGTYANGVIWKITP